MNAGDIVTLKRLTRPGLPNANGFIYEKNNFDEVLSDYIFKGGYVAIAPKVGCPTGSISVNTIYEDFNKDAYDKCIIPIESIIGHIESFDDETVTVKLMKNDKYEEYYDLITPDTDIYFRYMCNVSKEFKNVDNLYSNNIIIAHNIKINRIIVCDIPLM